MFGVNLVDPYGGLSFNLPLLGETSAAFIVGLFTRLLVGFGWYGLFKKAGKEKPWFAFIPLLGEYMAFRLAWDDFSLAAIFASVNFIGWACTLGLDAPLYVACSWIALILWWIMCLLTANVAMKASILWGFIYGAVPWAGALIIGWAPNMRYFGPWSSNPEDYDKKAQKKKRKQNRKK